MDACMLLAPSTRLPSKPFLEVCGKMLFEHGLSTLGRVFERVWLVCDERLEKRLRSMGYETIVDPLGIGPLGGLLVAAEKMEGSFFLVACDMPLLKESVLERMVEKYETLSADCVLVPRSKRLEVLHAIYPKLSAKVAHLLLSCGLYKLCYLLALLRVFYLNFEELRSLDPNLDCFFNVNTPHDFEELKRRVRAQG